MKYLEREEVEPEVAAFSHSKDFVTAFQGTALIFEQFDGFSVIGGIWILVFKVVIPFVFPPKSKKAKL